MKEKKLSLFKIHRTKPCKPTYRSMANNILKRLILQYFMTCTTIIFCFYTYFMLFDLLSIIK